MRNRFCERVSVGMRAGVVAVVLFVVSPSVAEAGFWCWLIGGCGSNGTSRQSAPLQAVPEIDLGALASALALAVGGAAMLGDRVRRRR
jgi:hypothetical protein